PRPRGRLPEGDGHRPQAPLRDRARPRGGPPPGPGLRAHRGAPGLDRHAGGPRPLGAPSALAPREEAPAPAIVTIDRMPATPRHRSVACRVGGVVVGGGAPIVVQSMTNTDTEDSASTAAQVIELARAGSELVRITVNTKKAAAQVAEIARRVRGEG